MDSLYDYSFTRLKQRLQEDGVNPVHATPLFGALHRDLKENLEGDNSLMTPVQKWLPGKDIVRPEKVKETPSADGWTGKYLLRFADGKEVETVLMGFPGRYTACISSQVGCAMGCVFCATGQMGFRRHLTAGEIVSQANFLSRILRERDDRLRNIVMMGMGEPLHNFDAVIEALDIVSDTRGLQISPPRIAISTVGHVDGILKLARVEKKYSLSVSLHGASNQERGELIPINKKWPLEKLLAACSEYSQIKQQRVMIAWTLIEGVNDSDDHASRLGALLKGMDVHVNLIPLNPTDGYGAQPPSAERITGFHDIVRSYDLPVTIRQRRGIDVGAGCGQLASSS